MGRGQWPVALAVILLLLGAAPAQATHVLGQYEGTLATGGKVSFLVQAPVPSAVSVAGFGASPWPMAKTDVGKDCRPAGLPESPLYNVIPIVDHAFSDTTPPTLVSGSFAAPLSASGTFRITADSWFPPPGEPPLGSTSDTDPLSWTASCTTAVPSPYLCSPVPEGGAFPTLPSTSSPPTFSGAGSGAKVSRTRRVTLPLTIGCPPPGAECLVSVVATARVPASAVARRKRLKVGSSAYSVKVGGSARARFGLTTKGPQTSAPRQADPGEGRDRRDPAGWRGHQEDRHGPPEGAETNLLTRCYC
jgi:hypothetical protein